MKITTLFIIAALFTMQASDSYGQRTKITLDYTNIRIDQLIDKIESSTEFRFVFKMNEVELDRFVSINVKNETIDKVLNRVFNDTKTDYKILNRRIYLTEKLENDNRVDQKIQNTNIIIQDLVSGTVTDENGSPLPGASIVEKGTTNGTQTDFDGNFSIAPTSDTAVLVVSYIGFTSKEIPVEGQTILQISLSPDTANLDEVVVVGYGSVSKRKLTGAVASIKSNDFEDIPTTSIEQSIAGQLPGVEITQNSGQPGQANGIIIRGVGTITAGSQPLIVVDGLPLSQGTSLNTINPNDIASVEVLKDAASAAIYGSRGANGVVIITTKKGKSGKPQFSYNSFIGFQQLANRLDLMNAQQHAIWSRDARNNYYLQFDDGTFSINDGTATREANAAALGFNPRKAIIPSYIQPWLNGGDTSGLVDTDWQDEVFRTALIQNHQLSVRGGNENLSYFVSGDYFDQEGIALGSDFERFSFRANIEAQLSKKLKLGVSMAPSYNRENVLFGGFSGSPINGAIISLPYFPVRNADGSLAISEQVTGATEGDQARPENPVAIALLKKDERRNAIFQGNGFLELELLKGLKAKTFWGIDYTSNRRETFDPGSVGRRNVAAPDIPFGSTSSSELVNWLVENTLTYERTFGEKHNFNALLGTSFQEETFSFSEVTATDFPNDFVETLNAGIVNGGTSTSTKSVLVSYLARVQYDYDDKYLFTAAVRRDGSSRFGSNTRFGTFPSASFGYRISEEDFFPKSKFLNDLKFRASWGITGNNQIGDFGSQALLNASNAILVGGIQSGLSPSTSPNPNLSWEETNTVDLGLDLGLFNNALTASIDYYKSTTNDLLLEVPVPAHSGFTSSLQNIGEVENSGIEFVLRGNYNLGPVKAVTSFNIASNKNKVLQLGPGQEEIITRNGITRIGGELGALFGYRTNGVFTSQEQIDNTPSLSTAQVGEYIYEDTNNDGQINSDDRVVLGSIFPDYTFGLNTNFQYKNFDLGVVVQGVQGVDIRDLSITVLLYNPEGWGNGTVDHFNNYYTPERGANSIYARPNSLPRDNGFYRTTDVLQEDASFVRVRNITLGYTLPKKVSESLGITSLRIYGSSKNPFTFTDYRGYNPEQRTNNALDPVTGFDNYPVEKSFVLGMNLNF
ncbi:TonB-dependent receptor [Maribacter sp. 2304DJ31-5]|uniref:TonB-dependent receptor n=1 Tax=Maribacter sp. 2304DJ31-5 TaxID=3386273 RepID=UPI0039BC5141